MMLCILQWTVGGASGTGGPCAAGRAAVDSELVVDSVTRRHRLMEDRPVQGLTSSTASVTVNTARVFTSNQINLFINQHK